MNITRARNSARRALVAGIIASMLAVGGPAHAGGKKGGGGGGGGIKLDNDVAVATGGNGGNGGVAVGVSLLNCLLLLVDCGDVDLIGAATAPGGNGGDANATNFS